MPSLPPILRSVSTTSKWWSWSRSIAALPFGASSTVVSRFRQAADQSTPECIVIVRYQNSSHG